MTVKYSHRIKVHHCLKKSFIEAHPDIEKALNQLEGKISDEEMQEMNYRVAEKMKILMMSRKRISRNKA